MLRINISLAVISFLLVGIVCADVPGLINIQGRLVDGAGTVNGSVALVLRVYDADSGGTLLYADSNSVAVIDGLYATFLGDDTVSGDLSEALTHAEVFLETEVDGVVLSPRERMVSVPYALQAGSASGGFSDVQAGTIEVIGDFENLTLHISTNFPSPFSSQPIVTVSPLFQAPMVEEMPEIALTSVTTNGFGFSLRINQLSSLRAVDSAGNVGNRSSLAVVNGKPAISYYDATSMDLRYVQAVDPDGNAWGTPIAVDTNGAVGSHSSLAIVNGKPAISYTDGLNSGLRYVQASDSDGSVWGASVAVDTNGIVGGYTTLAVVNGNPAISYWDFTSDLRFVRATDADGSAWGNPVSAHLSAGGLVGQYSSLAVVNGNPAISYYESPGHNLRYVRATDADGSGWGVLKIIDSIDSVGSHTSLAVVNGNPAISYYDATHDDLKYARASDPDGDNWGTILSVDTNGNVGSGTSLAVVNGKPAISYIDLDGNDLKFVAATDVDGTTWGTPRTLDTNRFVSTDTSLAEVNGNPGISYYDVDDGDLRFAGFPRITIQWVAVQP